MYRAAPCMLGHSAVAEGSLMRPIQRFVANDGNAYDIETGYCAGVITGVGSMGPSFPPGSRSCAPNSATVTQATRVALAYIERYPQRMHESFARLAVEAWHEAWPCK